MINNWFPRNLVALPSRQIAEEVAFFNKLISVKQPGQYVGEEYGIPANKKAEFRYVLSYPDLYEIGMSNYGIAILYEAINSLTFATAERVFMPDSDMEELLLATGRPLYSLENYLPVNTADIWGFNLNHELLFSNILAMIKLAGLEIEAGQRSEEDPIIIFGGSAAHNPAPLKKVADLFFIGDGDAAIKEITSIVYEGKNSGLSKKKILQKLVNVQGIYYPPYHDSHGIRVEKEYLPRQAIQVLQSPIIPNIKISQSRLIVELFRGCGWGCRYCQAGFIKKPLRYFEKISAEKILRAAINGGWDEISLNALSVSDYPWLYDLVEELASVCYPEGISLSLPSLRANENTIPLIEATGGVRKSSLTFAIESGSRYLREVIRKNVEEDNLYHMAEHFFRKGWDSIKLYFMIGLPNREGVDEAGEIIRVTKELSRIGVNISHRKSISISIAPFIPKPHTPFQWVQMEELSYFQDSLQRILREIPRRVKVSMHNAHMSILEGALSRGDENIFPVIRDAVIKGARFDGWGEKFNFDIWQEGFDQIYRNIFAEARKSYQPGDELPWRLINAIPEKSLQNEYEKSLQVSPSNLKAPRSFKAKQMDRVISVPDFPDYKLYSQEKWEFSFSKKGALRYISHLDFLELVRKALRRAELPMVFSSGYNKREKISLPPALSLGIASFGEPFIVDMFKELKENPSDIRERLNLLLPPGNELVSLKKVNKKNIYKSADYNVYFIKNKMKNLEEDFQADLAGFFSNGNLHKLKKSKRKSKNKYPKKNSRNQETVKKISDAIVSWRWDDLAQENTGGEEFTDLLYDKVLHIELLLDSPLAIGITSLIDAYTINAFKSPWYESSLIIRIGLHEKN